jgi:hypothetical protein
MAFKIRRIQALQKERERDTEEREHCAGVRLASRNVTVGRSSDVDLGFSHSPKSGEVYPNFTTELFGWSVSQRRATEFFGNLV